MLPREFFPDVTYSGMTPHQVQILLRIDRENMLERFLNNHFIPLLTERGYSLQNLLQALACCAFDRSEKAVAHYLWDAVANLDHKYS